jgi:phosphopantothenoylcysteine decarboxylase/phosphopantothenate--cysteine ligase
MTKACLSKFRSCDIAILSAAVADYTPVNVEKQKIKKKDAGLTLNLKPTTDIAATLGKMKTASQLVAGFSLETSDEIKNATGKMKQKNLDFIVLNSLRDSGSGFDTDTNRITIIDKYNNIDKFELKSKEDAARDILDKIVSMIK